MQSASSIEESKSVKERSSKTPAKGAESKDSDKKAKIADNTGDQVSKDVESSVQGESEQPSSSLLEVPNSDSGVSTSSVEGEGKSWYGLLQKKIGLNINSRKWIEDHPELARKNKSELIIRLALELCLAKNTEYDPESDSIENEDGKCSTFDAKMIFALFEVVSEVIKKSDRRMLVEFVCRKDNVKLLEMICRQENKDGGGKAQVNEQYPWKGEFTGYERLTDLLQYVLEQRCSSEIVLCIAEKVYGGAHIIYNGEQYLDDVQVRNIKRNFDYQDSVIKDCLKAAIELSYKDVVQVMLGGDIYHCIRLMKGEKFQEEKRFGEALDIVKETVAEVMSSWVNDERQSFKDDIQRLLKEGMEVDINTMGKKDFIDELESRGIKLSKKDKKSKDRLVEKLKEEGRGKVKLSKTVVGGLVSTLFFDYRMKEPFELETSHQGKSRREKEIDELNKGIGSNSFVKGRVLEKIKLLNSSSHVRNDWFFREVLSAIVNDEGRLGKLQAVCTAICKEKVEELLKGAKVHEDVVDTLKFFGVDPLALEKSNVVANIPLLRISPPDSPGSKAVERKNKGFMQSNCGQGENSSYNKGENSHRHGGKVGSISRRLGMPRADLRLARQRKKKNKEGVASHKSIQAVYEPPSFQDLSEANRMMYIKKALDEFVLSYSTLSYRSLYGANRLPQSLNESMGSSGSYEDEQEFNDLFVNNSCYDKYEDAINKLKNGDILEAQKLLIELVEQGVAPAAYVRALVLFKELVKQCDVHNNVEKNTVVMREGADDIKEAVELLEFCTDEMKPASSFLTGMMKAFNVGECRQFMGGAWKDDLVHVVNVAKIPGDSEFEQSVLHGISSSGWDAEECGIGMKEKREDIKKMFKYSLYEIVQGMLSKSKFDSTVVENSFITLSKGHDFPEGLYGYGFALVRNKVAGDFQENMEKAIDLLDRASSQGHEGAKLLLGVLPFKNDAYCETRRERVSCIRVLEDYVRKSDDLCLMNKKNVDKMALCLAAGYCSRKSAFLEHNEQKAKEILELRGLHEEWDNLQQKSKMIFDDDSSAFLAPLSSTKNTARSSFSGFPDDYDAINKTPASELGDASVQNQGVSGKFKQ